jgi:nitroimidazol reductase NimA-like FMN-containing flavoprotein (pyridoxamine 5'-phosphate oxidase superfamily)
MELIAAPSRPKKRMNADEMKFVKRNLDLIVCVGFLLRLIAAHATFKASHLYRRVVGFGTYHELTKENP